MQKNLKPKKKKVFQVQNMKKFESKAIEKSTATMITWYVRMTSDHQHHFDTNRNCQVRPQHHRGFAPLDLTLLDLCDLYCHPQCPSTKNGKKRGEGTVSIAIDNFWKRPTPAEERE